MSDTGRDLVGCSSSKAEDLLHVIECMSIAPETATQAIKLVRFAALQYCTIHVCMPSHGVGSGMETKTAPAPVECPVGAL